MKNKLALSGVSSAVLLMICGSLFAHHGSRAAYDFSKPITQKATVTGFEFENPHVYILYDVKDDKGNLEHWGAETFPPTIMARDHNWNRNTLKLGDQIMITVCPSKFGAPRGFIMKVLLPDGKVVDLSQQQIEQK